MDENQKGPDLAIGTVEEATAMIGTSSDVRYAQEPVSEAMIRYFASTIADGNPTYWDPDFATTTWGGICCPPAQLMAWKMPPLWAPDIDEAALTRPPMFAMEVPFPRDLDSIINVGTDTSYARPVHAGDWLHWRETIVDVSPEKTTRLGTGHFLTTETIYRNQTGREVATYTHQVYRYEPTTGADDDTTSVEKTQFQSNHSVVDTELTNRYESLDVGDASIGDTLPQYDHRVTQRNVIQHVAATRDFYPGHHDPQFARYQGNRSIYLNTMVLQGLADKLAARWAGPTWRVQERSIEIHSPAQVGDTLSVTGEVTDIVHQPGPPSVELAIDITDDSGRTISQTTVEIVRDPIR